MSEVVRSARCEQQLLQRIGNTVRAERSGLYAVLVVGDTLTSHFWQNLLPLARDPSVRHFVTVEDLQTAAPWLHVHPTLVPAFLVFQHGFAVDWFPAPLPRPMEVVDPVALVESVRCRLRSYA